MSETTPPATPATSTTPAVTPPVPPAPTPPVATAPAKPPAPTPPRAPSPSTRDTVPVDEEGSKELDAPQHDLTKRFHLTAGKTVLGTYDTREEADTDHEKFKAYKNHVLEKAAEVTHLAPTTIIDRGPKFPKPETT